MPAVVVDTHSIVWYLSADSRLSSNAADALDSATAAGETFMCIDLCRGSNLPGGKGRLPIVARDRLISAIGRERAEVVLIAIRGSHHLRRMKTGKRRLRLSLGGDDSAGLLQKLLRQLSVNLRRPIYFL